MVPARYAAAIVARGLPSLMCVNTHMANQTPKARCPSAIQTKLAVVPLTWLCSGDVSVGWNSWRPLRPSSLSRAGTEHFDRCSLRMR
jgi:hypothetical protein